MAPTLPLRSLMPGPGNTAGVDGGAVSGVSEVIAGSLQGSALASATITSSNVAANLIQTISVTPANSAIITMYTLGIQIIPAVANKSIILLSAVLRYVYGVHAFTSGGAVQLQYDSTLHAGGVTPLTTVAAAQMLATASSDNQMQQAAATTIVPQNKGIFAAAATQDFAIAAGNTSSVTFIVQYVVV